MKSRFLKSLASILLAVLTCSSSLILVAQQPTPAPQRQEQPKSQTVYVTRTGKRYHRENCRYLASSKIPMSLKDAKQNGYTPCKVCRPAQ